MAWSPGEELVLTKAVKENIGWIRGAVYAGLAPQTAYDLLRSVTSAGRKQSFLDAYRAMEYSYKDPTMYLPLDYNQRPDTQFIPLSPFNQRKAYHADVKVTFYNTLDGILEERPVTVMFDNMVTVNEILEGAHALVESYAEYESVQYDLSRIERINYSDNPISGI